MLDTMWAVVVPGAAGAWSILVGRAFFKQTVPNELAESAKVDGASDIQIFFRIAIPLSAPIIATLALFHGVGLWNEYFKALIYLPERDKFTLQLVLRELLVVSQERSEGVAEIGRASCRERGGSGVVGGRVQSKIERWHA